MAGRPSLVSATPGFTLPALERLLPPPPPDLVAARIEAHTVPGEVVLDPFGRGGWIARAALDASRRAISVELDPLARLLAEIVLRPPDLRHLDAAFQALGASPRGETSLRVSIGATFASRCPTCGRQVVLDDLVWEPQGEADAAGGDPAAGIPAADDPAAADAPAAEPAARDLAEETPAAASEATAVPIPAEGLVPARKAYPCLVCRDRRARSDVRHAPVDAADIALALADPGSAPARAALRDRFPERDGARGLADAFLDLHSPRQLVALNAILERIEGDLRAAPIEAALRLAFLHAIAPASRLSPASGRPAALRIVAGQVRRPGGAWRERNPWITLEEGMRAVRGFLQQLEAGPVGPAPARLGEDLRSLAEGATSTILAVGGPDTLRTLLGTKPGSTRPSGPRVRLVVGQPPPRPNADRLAALYHGTAWAIGREAAAGLPVSLIGAPLGRVPWGWQAAAVRRALEATAPALAREARIVLLVEPGGPEALAAAALGATAAGYRLLAARLADAEEATGGTLELVGPGAPVPQRALDRANRSLEPLPGGAGDPMVVPGRGLFSPPERIDARPFSAADAAAAIERAAVELLKARGEPASIERLFGELLVGLDRAGILRRLVIAQPVEEPPLASATDGGIPSAGADGPARRHDSGRPYDSGRPSDSGRPDASSRPEALDPAARREPPTLELGLRGGSGPRHQPPGLPSPVAARASRPVEAPPDPVERLVALIRDTLAADRRPVVSEIEPGRWWLADPADREAAQAPLADRLEWAVYSLLSTAGPIPVAAFQDRIAALFPGHDLPDEGLVAACLESYRDPTQPAGLLSTRERLPDRTVEHGELLAMLADGGHRLGMRVWLGRREQRRIVRGRPLGDRLDERERTAYLPLVIRAPADLVADVDAIWYVRDRVTMLFEVEWTAILAEVLLRRHARLPTDDRTVRFLVVPDARTELVRAKLARSPLLRAAIAEGNWHLLKWHHLRQFLGAELLRLDDLQPFLGLDPLAERGGEQLPLFG